MLLSSRTRWALMTELRDNDERPLADLLKQLDPVDLILVEGYKRDAHPKIEAYRGANNHAIIAKDDDTVRAIASDCALDVARPLFDLNDTKAIADFILSEVGL